MILNKIVNISKRYESYSQLYKKNISQVYPWHLFCICMLITCVVRFVDRLENFSLPDDIHSYEENCLLDFFFSGEPCYDYD